MKKLFLMAAAVTALFMVATTSCSGSKNDESSQSTDVPNLSSEEFPSERSINVKKADFSGFAGKYLEVVPGEYQFYTDGTAGRISITLRKTAHPEITYTVGKDERLRLNAIGKSGEVFDTGMFGFETRNQEFDKVKDLLANGEVGDTRSINFKWRGMSDQGKEQTRMKIYKSAEGIEIIDQGFEKE